MSAETIRLINAFEALPLEEKQAFANQIFHRLPPYDSGPLDDEVAPRAGDGLAVFLEQEVNGAETR